MALALFRPPENSQGIALFGKLPHRPDYLRVNASHPACVELDDLLERAMARIGQTPEGTEGFDRADPLDLLFLTHDRRWAFLGSLMPSQDLSGRRYPLVGGLLVPGSALQPHVSLMPIAVEVFLSQLRQHLREAVAEATDALACREFLQQHAESGGSGIQDAVLAGEVLDRHLRDAPANTLEEALRPLGQEATLRQALLNLMFYGDFLRRFGGAPVLQEVRLPLSGLVGDVPLHASDWLTILQAAWGGDLQAFGRVWALRRGSPSSLHLYPGAPSEAFMASLLGGDLPGGARLELESEQRAWMSHRMYAETAYAFDRFFADLNWRLLDLLNFLRETGRRIASAPT